MMDDATLSSFFQNTSEGKCFNYSQCKFEWSPCKDFHPYSRYSDASAAFVLIASIVVFFMKAGFLLLEISFAKTVKEKRKVVIVKHMDAFASAFGFFLIGFDSISGHTSPQGVHRAFFTITDPILWFFKFTFASNTATIIGGCLVTNKYKMRLPAAYISAFVISGIAHPLVALLIWSDKCYSWSPYRFCEQGSESNKTCFYNCTSESWGLMKRMYVLDFAGGGAVHLVGGTFGLVLCLFAKLQEWWDARKAAKEERHQLVGEDDREEIVAEGFWDWMYPVHGGEELVSEAALGVIILWFCWFAFNCGSTESVEANMGAPPHEIPYHGIPSIIAINMIMSVAAGGTIAVMIAVWAQTRYRTQSVNSSEVANGILSSLVAITAGCPFVDYWGACFIGVGAVLFYHIGCWLEYKFKIKDTARIVPVHAVCGLWSLIGTAIFLAGTESECNLHGTFEGLCYCALRLPRLNWAERLLGQCLGGLMMIGISGVFALLVYGVLYIVPIQPFVYVASKVLFLNPTYQGQKPAPLHYKGGWLLTHPDEDHSMQMMHQPLSDPTARGGQATGENTPVGARAHTPPKSNNTATVPSNLENDPPSGACGTVSSQPSSQQYGTAPSSSQRARTSTSSRQGTGSSQYGAIKSQALHVNNLEDGSISSVSEDERL